MPGPMSLAVIQILSCIGLGADRFRCRFGGSRSMPGISGMRRFSMPMCCTDMNMWIRPPGNPVLPGLKESPTRFGCYCLKGKLRRLLFRTNVGWVAQPAFTRSGEEYLCPRLTSQNLESRVAFLNVPQGYGALKSGRIALQAVNVCQGE